MAIVSNIDDVRDIISIYAGMDFDSLKPFIDYVEEDNIVELIGEDLYDTLSEDTTHNEVNEALRKKIAAAVVPLAFYDAAPTLDVGIGPGGFTVQKTDSGISPASQARVVAFRRSQLDVGHKRIDSLLRFIEKNKEDYPDLDQSALESKMSYIIRDAKIFNDQVRINNSRYLFIKMLPIMQEKERNIIAPILSSSLYETIIASEKAGSTTAANKKLIPYLRRILANLTFADALTELAINIDDRGITLFNGNATEAVNVQLPAPPNYIQDLKESKMAKAQFEIDQLVELLNANSSDYPGFENSTYYVEESLDDDEGANGIISGEGWSSFI